MVCFRKFTEFPRRTMYDILHDAYSYDSGNKIIWDDRHRPEQVEIGRNGLKEKAMDTCSQQRLFGELKNMMVFKK